MAVPSPYGPAPGKYTPTPKKRAKQPQEFFTFKPSDPRSHMKVPKGMAAAFVGGKGWHAVAKKAIEKKVGGFTGTTSRPSTLQARTIIESPAQIEERVTRMAQTAFDRQKSTLDLEAEQMRKEAEGRRLGMIEAYKAAGLQNAAMGGQVQDAWQQAAGSLSGIAGTTSGTIADALQRDLATQEQALSRVGAAGTGFDARSQAAVEAYRSGVIPSEEFTRLGAVGNEYLLRSGDNLARQGLQTGYADESAAVAKVNADRLAEIAKLGENRLTYEQELRKELTGSQEKQLEAQADALANAQKAKADADKLVFSIKSAKAKLDQQWAIAKMSATTKKELAAIDQIYKDNKLALDQQLAGSLENQRNASAEASRASAGLSDVKAAAGGFAPKAPKGPKSASPTQVMTGVKNANAAGNDRLTISLTNIYESIPGFDVPADMTPEEYEVTPAYREAVALQKKKRTKAFGTIMGHVTRAITAHLKAVGYTPAQIKVVAYNIVSAKVTPPKGWKRPTAAPPKAAPPVLKNL